MPAEKTFLTAVEDALKKSPLLTNVILSLVLAGLEKITETEFACPCSPGENSWFSAGFFVVPSILIFLLMMITREWKCDCSLLLKNIGISLIPPVIWLILVFMDGRYFACAMTSWNGRYVILDGAGSKKWCEPDETNFTQQYMTKTKHWFSVSQWIGIGIASLLAFALGIYAICFCCKFTKAGNNTANAGTTDQGEGQNTNQQDQEASPFDPDTSGFQDRTAGGNSFELQNENENSGS